jgi:hypothetical protein
VAGIELNIQKLLEDVWAMKTRERVTASTVKECVTSNEKCLSLFEE